MMPRIHYIVCPWPSLARVALPTVGRKLASLQLSAVSVVLSWSMPCSRQAGWSLGRYLGNQAQTTGLAFMWGICRLCLLCSKNVRRRWEL